MKRFHINKCVDQQSVRFYCKDLHTEEAFDNRENYDALIMVKYLTPNIAFISNFISKVPITGDDIREFKLELKASGVTQLVYERGGEIKLEVL